MNTQACLQESEGELAAAEAISTAGQNISIPLIQAISVRTSGGHWREHIKAEKLGTNRNVPITAVPLF
eukprot:4105193-Amphidinium_carterae.1